MTNMKKKIALEAEKQGMKDTYEKAKPKPA